MKNYFEKNDLYDLDHKEYLYIKKSQPINNIIEKIPYIFKSERLMILKI